MMKKTVHIIIVCLFFLLGLQSSASEKKTSLLACTEICQSQKAASFSTFADQKKKSYFSTPEKLQKKKRFSKTQQNAITNFSKCKGFSVNSSTVSTSKNALGDYSELHNDFSGYAFYKSFCHRKLLSIFYSFQAFW